MNQTHMKERNYKMVENLRQQNMREQRRLNDKIGNRQGMKAAYNYEIASLSYEQKKLRQEMLKIKQSTPTSANVWTAKTGRSSTEPIRSHHNGHMVPHSGHVTSGASHMTGSTSMIDLHPAGKGGGSHHNAQQRGGGGGLDRSISLPAAAGAHTQHTAAGAHAQDHLQDSRNTHTTNHHQPPHHQQQPKMKIKPMVEHVGPADDGAKLDPMKYNPDGSLRTKLAMPDFRKTMREAQKARYVRHKEKQWYEQELSVNDIFDKELEIQQTTA